TAVRLAVGVRKHPLAIPMLLHLAPKNLLRLAVEDHGAGATLRAREQNRTLLEMHVVRAYRQNLAFAHQGQRRQFGDLPERRRHWLEDQQFLLWSEPSNARIVRGKECSAREAVLGTNPLERRAQRPEVAIYCARLAGDPPFPALTCDGL